MIDAVAVLGGGHGAHAMAADLVSRGFSVNLFELRVPEQPAQALQHPYRRRVRHTQGHLRAQPGDQDIDQAIDGVKYILIVTPAFAHDSYARLLRVGQERPDHRRLPRRVRRPALPDRGRRRRVPRHRGSQQPAVRHPPTAPCEVPVYGRDKVNVAFMPADKGPEFIDELRAIHPYEKVYSTSWKPGSASSTPRSTAGPCLLSLTAIEKLAEAALLPLRARGDPGLVPNPRRDRQ